MDGFKQHTSGLYLPEDYKPYPIAMDLFSGCGGFSLGFITGGFQVIAGFDNDPWAAHTYMCNLGSYPIQIHYTSDKYEKQLTDHFERVYKNQQGRKKKKGSYKVIDPMNGWVESKEVILLDHVSGSGWIRSQRMQGEYYPPVTHYFFGDVSDIDGAWILDKLDLERGDLDCVMGGPPCQGYSKANNKRSVMDPRNSLVFDFARLVNELYPKNFVMEEVPEILKMVTPEGESVVDKLCLMFEKGGYGTAESIKKGMFNCGKSAKIRTQERTKEDETEEEEQLQTELFMEAI